MIQLGLHGRNRSCTSTCSSIIHRNTTRRLACSCCMFFSFCILQITLLDSDPVACTLCSPLGLSFSVQQFPVLEVGCPVCLQEAVMADVGLFPCQSLGCCRTTNRGRFCCSNCREGLARHSKRCNARNPEDVPRWKTCETCSRKCNGYHVHCCSRCKEGTGHKKTCDARQRQAARAVALDEMD